MERAEPSSKRRPNNGGGTVAEGEASSPTSPRHASKRSRDPALRIPTTSSATTSPASHHRPSSSPSSVPAPSASSHDSTRLSSRSSHNSGGASGTNSSSSSKSRASGSGGDDSAGSIRERSKSDARRSVRERDGALWSASIAGSSSARRHQENGGEKDLSSSAAPTTASASTRNVHAPSATAAVTVAAAAAPTAARALSRIDRETRLERRRSLPAHISRRHAALVPSGAIISGGGGGGGIKKKLRRQKSDDLGALVGLASTDAAGSSSSSSSSSSSAGRRSRMTGGDGKGSSGGGHSTRGLPRGESASSSPSLLSPRRGRDSGGHQRTSERRSGEAPALLWSRGHTPTDKPSEKSSSSSSSSSSPSSSSRQLSAVVGPSPRERRVSNAKRSDRASVDISDRERTLSTSSNGSDQTSSLNSSGDHNHPHGSGSSSTRRKDRGGSSGSGGSSSGKEATEAEAAKGSGGSLAVRRSERAHRRRSDDMRAAGFVPASGDEHGTRSSGGGGGGGSQATAHPVAPPPAPAKREPRDKSKRATLRMNWTVGTKGASGKRESVLSLVTAAGGPQPEKARTPRGTSSLRPQQPSVTASGGHRRGDGRGADDSGSGGSSSSGDRRSNREDGKERKERKRGDDHSGGGDRKERKRGDANAVQAKSEAKDAGDGENGKAKRSKDRGNRDAADTKPKREKKKEKKDEEDRGHHRRRNDDEHKKESADQSHKAVANDRKPAESDIDSDDDADAGGGSSTGSAIVYSAEEAAQREAEEREALQREIGRVAVILAEAKEAVRHPASQGASATPTKTPVSQTMLHSDGFAPLRHRSDDTGLGMSASDSHVPPPSHQSRSASLSAYRPPPGLSAAAESTDAAAMMMTSSATELGDRRESAAFARLLERQRHMGSSSTVGRANSRQIERPPLAQTEGALTPTRSSTVSKRHSRRRTLTAQELLDKYFAQQQQQQQAQQQQQQQQQRQTTNLIHHGKLGSATVGRTSRTNSVGMRKRPGLLVFPDSASELDGSSSPSSSGSMTATGGSSSLTSSATDVYPAGGLRISSSSSSTPTATALRPASSLAQSQPSLRSLSDSLSAVATTVAVAAAAGVDEAASPAAAVLSPRKRGDLRQMLRMSGERFIVPKPAGSDLARSRGKAGLMPRALLFVPPSPSVAAGKMTDSGDSTCRADDGDEDDDNDDSEESEEDDDDDEEEDDEDDDDDDDDDDEPSHEGDMTLETAIREQRLGAIAAVLRRLDAHNTGGGPRHRRRAASASASVAAAAQLSRIPSLLVDDADGNPGPGGSPLHLAASLSPAHKRRDKVFEYLMNYGVKHRQRREDDDDEKAALLNNGGVGVGIAGGREAQLVVGRKRKQSYAVARRRAGLGGDDEEGDEDGSDDGDDGRPEGVVVDWERDEIPAWQWIDAPNREGDTALHVAAAKGFLFAVTKLLQDGLVDPDIVNMMGRTALHLACRWGRTDVCVTLLAAGATLDRVDDKGKTAYDLATQHGHAECASLLMKEGADALLHYQCPPVPTSSQRYENKGLAETTHDRFGWVVRETTRARAHAPPTTASGSSSSSSCNQSVSSSSNTTASKRMELRDVRREKKWKEMLKRWDQAEAGRADWERPPKDPKFQKKLRQRVLKGIPNRLRGQVWARLAQTEELRARQGGSIFDPWRQGSKYIKQIDMDIEQTDRDHIFYRQRYGPKQRSLFAVLKAYSVHNPLVGYMQGLAQITSTILMYIDDEEEVFWILDSMIQSYGLEDLYKPDFPGLKKVQP